MPITSRIQYIESGASSVASAASGPGAGAAICT
jgi:hypothetical protein